MTVKDNIYSSALDGAVEIIEEISGAIAEELKGAAPFDKEPIPDDEMLYEYNTMTFDKLNALIDLRGRDWVNQYIERMEMLKRKKQGGL